MPHRMAVLDLGLGGTCRRREDLSARSRSQPSGVNASPSRSSDRAPATSPGVNCAWATDGTGRPAGPRRRGRAERVSFPVSSIRMMFREWNDANRWSRSIADDAGRGVERRRERLRAGREPVRERARVAAGRHPGLRVGGLRRPLALHDASSTSPQTKYSLMSLPFPLMPPQLGPSSGTLTVLLLTIVSPPSRRSGRRRNGESEPPSRKSHRRAPPAAGDLRVEREVGIRAVVRQR